MINLEKFQFGNDFNPDEALKASRVLYSENITNSEIVIGITQNENLTRIATKGNISCIIGKAKSRKTFFISMLCAAILKGDFEGKIKGKFNNKIVVFDTEQGRWHVQNVLKRIVFLSGCNESVIEIYSLRKYSPLQRWEVIDNYFHSNSPDFVVIDGIRDLISDINSAEQSTDISTQLLKWSEERNCHIMNVLHMNKGDMNARGHLGTELVNKSESVITITKERGDNYSKVESEYMRGLHFEPFLFEVCDGIPTIISDAIIPINGTNYKAKAPF